MAHLLASGDIGLVLDEVVLVAGVRRTGGGPGISGMRLPHTSYLPSLTQPKSLTALVSACIWLSLVISDSMAQVTSNFLSVSHHLALTFLGSPLAPDVLSTISLHPSSTG